MGNSQSELQSQELFKEFKRNQWQRLKDRGFYELWENSKTGQVCEAYKLDYIPQQDELEHYRFRHYNQNADNFVQIRYVDVQKNRSLCNHGLSYVLTQFIPVKLSEMSQLTVQEGYSILRASYRAFHTMEAFHGPFVPNQDLIGVNLSGKPKIWLNKDHSKNKADRIIQAQIWQKHLGEVSENVKKIAEMIQQKVKQRHFPRQFREYFFNNIMNFSQASEYVQQYCEKHKIIIPLTINYGRFISDNQIQSIVSEYKIKKNSSINQRLNTLESYQHSKSFAVLKQQDINNLGTLRKNESHRNFSYHQNMHITQIARNPYLTTIQNGNANQNNINFVVLPRPNFHSPLIQRVKTTPVILTQLQILNQINPQLIQNAPHKIHQVGTIKIVIPSRQLRSTFHVAPVEQKNVIFEQKPEKIQQNLLNMKTPQHVSNHIVFIPPNRIKEFSYAQRGENIQFKPTGNLSKELQTKEQQKERNKSRSIHEKIKEFQHEQKDLNMVNLIKASHQQQLQGYINSDSEQKNEEEGQIYEENNTSEPDWEHMQHQNQVREMQARFNQNQENQYYQYQHQQQMRMQDEVHHSKGDVHEVESNQNDSHQSSTEHNEIYRDISPIKLSTKNSHQHFQNESFAMFSKYAQLNQQHGTQAEHVYDQHQQEEFNQQQRETYQSFQPRNRELNESKGTQKSEDQDSHNIHEQLSAQQPLSSSNELQASERARHQSSSKNTSLNRGQGQEQSSGTLVVHESKENIYNGVNQQKPAKVVINNIRQESHESDNQSNEQNAFQERMRVLNDNYDSREDRYYEAEKYFEPHQSQENSQNDQLDQKQQNVNKSQQVPQKVADYANLHFRNESDQLYQYTPVQSVYRKDVNHDNAHPSHYYERVFNNKRPTGVEEIVTLQRHEDIEEYVRRKYSNMINGPNTISPQLQDQNNRKLNHKQSNRAMTFAKPKIEQQQPIQNDQGHSIRVVESSQKITKHYYHHENGKNQIQKIQSIYQPYERIPSEAKLIQKKASENHSNLDDNDFLDVGNLEKSLDQKYRALAQQQMARKLESPKFSSGNNIKGSQTMSEDDGMNVAALQKKLLKFEQRQSIQREKSQRKLQTYQQQQPEQNNGQLNFNELDNIVQLMDKKIQQSQKKQQSSNTSRDRNIEQKISEFNNSRQGRDPLQSVDLQASISNQQMSLQNMPILREEHISNASNSTPHSTRQNFYKFGMDSQDFATGRGSNSINLLTKKISGASRTNYNYLDKYETTNGKYTSKYDNLTPVLQLDKKYQIYSSKNYSAINQDYNPSTLPSDYQNTIRRKSSRRNTRNNDDVKKLVDQISNKYEKYVTSGNSNKQVSDRQSSKPFAKKAYYDTSSNYNQTKYDITSYPPKAQSVVSRGSRVSGKGIQRKTSSYLNTIQQLNGEYNASPFKKQSGPASNNYYQKLSIKENQPNQQNYLNLSNRNSNNASTRNIGTTEQTGRRSNSKISYQDLKDLLWK